MTDFPLSFAQRRTWFLDELQADEYGFGDHRLFRVTGPLDLAALRSALAALVARHEPLRTTFVADPPTQRVWAVGELPLNVVDVTDVSAALSAARRLAAVRFDVSAGPLARVTVLRVDSRLSFLLLTFHLLVMDAWGLAVFCRDLGACYDGTAGDLPELAVQYADWSAWSRDELTDARTAELVAWWRTQLAGVPRLLTLPTRAGRPPRSGAMGRRRHRRLTLDLAAFARSEGVTVYAVLAAAHALTLARHSGQSKLAFGIPVANRELPDVQDLLGCFVDTVAVVVDVADGTFRDLCRQVGAATVAGYAHRALPFDQLVAALGEPRPPGRFPLVQAGFVHRPAGATGVLALSGCEVADEPLAIDRTRFEFTVRVDELPTGTVMSAEFDSALFEPAFVTRFLDDYVTTLTAAVADPTLAFHHDRTEPVAAPDGRPGGDSLELLTRLLRLRAEGRSVSLRALYESQ